MKKNIFFISSYFYPEKGAGAVRAFELVKVWCKQYNVDVFTNVPNYPLGVPYNGFKLKFPKDTDINTFKFNIHRVYTVLAENKGFVKRSLSYLFFCLSTFLNVLFYKHKPDVVVATTPQLLTSLSGVLVAQFYKVPFILDVRDLWPEAIVESGVSLNKLVLKILTILSRFAYKSAHYISVTTDVQKNKIIQTYKISSEKIQVIANGYNSAMFKAIDSMDERVLSFKKTFGPNRISIGYIGNLAFYYDFDVFIDLAQDFKDINFVVIGDGSQKEKLQNKLREASLSNLKLLDSIDYEDVPYAINALDMGIVKHQEGLQITESMRPVKLFEYVACDTPCIYFGSGEGKGLMEELGLKNFVLGSEQTYAHLRAKIEAYDFKKKFICKSEVLKTYTREALALKFQTNIIDKVIVP